jgi:hypothetical protein
MADEVVLCITAGFRKIMIHLEADSRLDTIGTDKDVGSRSRTIRKVERDWTIVGQWRGNVGR